MSPCPCVVADRHARLAAGLVLLLAAGTLPPSRVRGASPPDLPQNAALLLELVREGEPTGELLEVREEAGRLLATATAARSAGLEVREDTETLDLTAMGAELDAPNQRLILGGRTRVVTATRGEITPALPASWGALLDYDVQGLWGPRPGIGGTARLRGFGPPGLAETGLLLAYDGTEGTRARRLDSTVTVLRENGLLALRAGDVVTGGLGWTRPVRLGGFQASRDFSLRPDLVTVPLSGIGGRVAVPSTVDVLVDGTRRLSTEVPSGPFELRNLPVLNGAGQVTLAVRDAAGRESLDTLSFYASALLLAPGESTWSFSAGTVRRGFGTELDTYGEAAATASLRHGLTTDLTLETHLEGGGGALFGGAGASYRIGSTGLLSGSLAYGSGPQSRPDGRAQASGKGSGLRWGAAFERLGRVVSFNASTLRSAGSPRDVAAAMGDALPRAVDRAGLSISLGEWGNLGLGWTATRDAGDPTSPSRDLREGRQVELVNLSWTGRIADNAFAYASGYTAVRGGLGSGLVVGLSFGLGGDVIASTQAERRGAFWNGGVTAARTAVTEGDTGWRVNLAEGRGAISSASAEHRASFGTLGAAVERYDGQTYGRVTARGAVVAMGGLHAVPPVYDAFAVVDADGTEGVTVLRENQPVGRTGRDGRLLVTGLSSVAPNRLALDTLDQPMEAVTERPERQVRLPPRAGAVLRFPVVRAGMLTVLENAGGGFLPLNAGLADEAGHKVSVGLDGQAWWPEGAVGRITATLPGGARCVAPPAQEGKLRCA